MNVLVTGGAGFIGSNIVEGLLQTPGINKIRILDNLSTGFLENIEPFLSDPRVEFLQEDIRNLEACNHAVKGIDAVCHQAALGSVPRSINNPLLTHDNNVNGFLNILEASKNEGIKRLVYASSSSVYGDITDPVKKESRIGNHLSPYAVSKYSNELYAGVFSKCYGIQTIGFRYFNVFGPRQDPNGPYAAVIPLFIKAALKNQSPTINGDGTITRDFTFVKNVVQVNIKGLLHKNEYIDNKVLNIACGETTTLNQLWNQIKTITNAKTEPVYKENRKGDVLHSLADISKAKEFLNYIDVISLENGLKMTITWYHQKYFN